MQRTTDHQQSPTSEYVGMINVFNFFITTGKWLLPLSVTVARKAISFSFMGAQGCICDMEQHSEIISNSDMVPHLNALQSYMTVLQLFSMKNI
jgi:hypothetical protein